MGKYYENLDAILSLIKKLDKKHTLAEFIQDCIVRAKKNPELSVDEIIKAAKQRWLE